jgi:uncharacterized membrane protein YciS (DUF1049 family)
MKFLLGLLFKASVFIFRHWKPFAISAVAIILLVLMVMAWFKSSWDIICVILTFLLLVVALGVVIRFRKQMFHGFSHCLSQGRHRINSNVGIVLTVLGIVVTVLGLAWTIVQVEFMRDQLASQADNARKQIAAEQFKNAIEHLGSEKQTVVLGGVHALHNLAMNFPDDYSQPVFEVLCSFIHEETIKSEYQKQVLDDILYDEDEFADENDFIEKSNLTKIEEKSEIRKKEWLCGYRACVADLPKEELQKIFRALNGLSRWWSIEEPTTSQPRTSPK